MAQLLEPVTKTNQQTILTINELSAQLCTRWWKNLVVAERRSTPSIVIDYTTENIEAAQLALARFVEAGFSITYENDMATISYDYKTSLKSYLTKFHI